MSRSRLGGGNSLEEKTALKSADRGQTQSNLRRKVRPPWETLLHQAMQIERGTAQGADLKKEENTGVSWGSPRPGQDPGGGGRGIAEGGGHGEFSSIGWRGESGHCNLSGLRKKTPVGGRMARSDLMEFRKLITEERELEPDWGTHLERSRRGRKVRGKEDHTLSLEKPRRSPPGRLV